MKYAEFLMDDLFYKLDLKCLIKKFDKSRDISRERSAEFNLPLVNAKHGNNGIMYYGRKNEWEYDSMCLDIVNDGAIATGDVYPQPQDTGVLYNAYLIKPKYGKINEEILIYLSRTIEKSIKYKYSYDNKATWEKVKNDKILLPSSDGITPDYKYMSKYILLEKENSIAKLKKAISFEKLDDVKINNKDKQVLNKEIMTHRFVIDDLFTKICVKSLGYKVNDLKGKHDQKYCLPALTAGIENQGLSCYVPKENATILKNVISVSANGANTGAMFYQPNDFTVLQDSYAIKFKHEKFKITENVYLYFITALQKVIRGNYDWSKKAGWERIKKCEIVLPVINRNGNIDSIDYQYMNDYIEVYKKIAMQKLLKTYENI